MCVCILFSLCSRRVCFVFIALVSYVCVVEKFNVLSTCVQSVVCVCVCDVRVLLLLQIVIVCAKV